jgi:hypothetical protein
MYFADISHVTEEVYGYDSCYKVLITIFTNAVHTLKNNWIVSLCRKSFRALNIVLPDLDVKDILTLLSGFVQILGGNWLLTDFRCEPIQQSKMAAI